MARSILKFLLFTLITATAALLYWLLYDKPLIGVDDANIYFVYIKNFVDGHGLVYNIGGERVEGFTSFLWVFLLSPLYYLGENFEEAVLIFNVFLISCILFRVSNFLDYLNFGKTKLLSSESLFLLAFLILIPGFFEWNVLSLMETSFWCFLLSFIIVDLGYYILKPETKRVYRLSFYIFLLVLTRPESLLWGLFFATLLLFVLLIMEERKRVLLRRSLPIYLSFFLTLIALVVFRYEYFGYPLPNTYYSKVSTDTFYNIQTGLVYFFFSLMQSPVLWVLLLCIVMSLIITVPKLYRQFFTTKEHTDYLDKIQFVFALSALLSFFIPIYVGGDHFALLRFFQPLMPVYLLCMLNIQFWKKNLFTLNSLPVKTEVLKYGLVIGMVPFLYFSSKTPLHYLRKGRSPLYAEFTIADLGRKEGEKLNALFSFIEKPSIGVSAAGGFAFSYKGETVDLMGLNNTRMAHAIKDKVGMKNHAAFHVPTFLSIAPEVFHGYTHGSKNISRFYTSLDDVFLDENAPDFRESFVFRLFKGVFDDPAFKKDYKPVVISHPEVENLYYQTYVHVNFIMKLESHGYQVLPLER